MRGLKISLGMASALSLAACAVPPPSGPTVTSLPGAGKSYEAFQADDGACRYAATVQTGGAGPAQAATDSAVGTAVIGTALGAAAGALIGSASGNLGAGAAIGAGAGLIGGSAVGADGAQYSGDGLQNAYDTVYTQCMYAKGNTVQRPQVAVPVYGGYPPGYSPGYYYAPRPYYGRPYGYPDY